MEQGSVGSNNTTVTRTDAIATTIVIVFTDILLEVCKTLVQKGIDLQYEWASDGSFYITLLLLAQIGISAVIPIAWITSLRRKPREIHQTP